MKDLIENHQGLKELTLQGDSVIKHAISEFKRNQTLEILNLSWYSDKRLNEWKEILAVNNTLKVLTLTTRELPV